VKNAWLEKRKEKEEEREEQRQFRDMWRELLEDYKRKVDGLQAMLGEEEE
jgi:hypothetical protein